MLTVTLQKLPERLVEFDSVDCSDFLNRKLLNFDGVVHSTSSVILISHPVFTVAYRFRSRPSVTCESSCQIPADVSAATGKPLKTVVEALSKSFDGSNLAITRLGLGYDKAQLKAMSFNDIQKDLEKRFSGSALENAATFEGTMARFRITIDELKESLGQAVLPYLKKLAEYGIQIADAFGKDGVAGAFAELKFILQTLLYDENGSLNAAGQTLNDLIGKLNFAIQSINAISNTAGFTPGVFLAEKISGVNFTPTFGTVDPLAPSINPGSLRGIRGQNAGVNITVQTGIGDPVSIGRAVYNVLNQFERRNGGR